MTSSFKCYVDHSHTMYSSGNIDLRNWFHLFESPCILVNQTTTRLCRGQWLHKICLLVCLLHIFIFIYTIIYIPVSLLSLIIPRLSQTFLCTKPWDSSNIVGNEVINSKLCVRCLCIMTRPRKKRKVNVSSKHSHTNQNKPNFLSVSKVKWTWQLIKFFY